MSILKNFQLKFLTSLGNPEFGGDPDEYAESLYNQIRNAEVGDLTPRLSVKVGLRLRNGKSVVEVIPFEIVTEQFTNVRLLVGHYLTRYPALHLLAVEGRYLHGCVVKTAEVTHAEIIGENVEINVEDIRRTKFTAGGEDPTAVPAPLADVALADDSRYMF